MQTAVGWSYEYINATIWQSQINILGHLNSRPNGDVVAGLKPFYDIAAMTWPDRFKNYNFEQYLSFLLINGLIIQQQEKYFITDYGREFLAYCARRGYTGGRAF